VVQVGGKDIDGQDITPGSGFLVAKGLVVTSYSVVSKSVTTRLTFSSGAVANGTLTAVNRARTLALLRVGADLPRTLTVASSSTGVGDAVFAIAASASGSPKIAEVTLDQHSDPAQPGLLRFSRDLGLEFNGSPIINEKGGAIGVASTGPEGQVTRFIPAGPLGGLPNLDGFLGEQPAIGGGLIGGVPSKLGDGEGKEQPASPPKIVRAQGALIQGQALRRVEPMYPALARAARVVGVIVVEIVIDEKGDVLMARGLDGHPLLKSAAEAAAMGWLFKPTKFNGSPVKVIGTITFRFMP
jgi:TonB family protein